MRSIYGIYTLFFGSFLPNLEKTNPAIGSGIFLQNLGEMKKERETSKNYFFEVL